MTLTEFLLARIAEDEGAARLCAEMFPAPWDVADRGWRVRIYASDVAVEDFGSDDPDAMTTRNPVVMEVEPDRHIEDPRWLSDRVEHVRRHDPARVLAECEAKRRIVEMHTPDHECTTPDDGYAGVFMPDGPGALTACPTLLLLTLPYAGHSDYDPAWA